MCISSSLLFRKWSICVAGYEHTFIMKLLKLNAKEEEEKRNLFIHLSMARCVFMEYYNVCLDADFHMIPLAIMHNNNDTRHIRKDKMMCNKRIFFFFLQNDENLKRPTLTKTERHYSIFFFLLFGLLKSSFWMELHPVKQPKEKNTISLLIFHSFFFNFAIPVFHCVNGAHHSL